MSGDELRIYLDHAATTRVDPRVIEAMLPWMSTEFGNAASRHHAFGWEADAAVDRARTAIADHLEAAPRELVFTSGATEANNLALFGLAGTNAPGHLVASAVEHPSVLDPFQALEARGWELSRVPVDGCGRVDPDAFAAALRPETRVASLQLVNNEVGTIQPVAEVAEHCRRAGVPLHCDATQALGKLPVSVRELGVDLLAGSAHKFHGPKGVGFLWLRRSGTPITLEPILHGGGHERGLRSGTLNVPAIVGMATALDLAIAAGPPEQQRIAALRDRLESELLAAIPDVVPNGPPAARVAGICNLSFRYVDGEPLLRELDGVAASSGSACASARLEPSPVLLAMGRSEALARGSVRFSFGRDNSEEEIAPVVARVTAAVERLRERSPQARMARVASARSEPGPQQSIA